MSCTGKPIFRKPHSSHLLIDCLITYLCSNKISSKSRDTCGTRSFIFFHPVAVNLVQKCLVSCVVLLSSHSFRCQPTCQASLRIELFILSMRSDLHDRRMLIEVHVWHAPYVSHTSCHCHLHHWCDTGLKTCFTEAFLCLEHSHRDSVHNINTVSSKWHTYRRRNQGLSEQWKSGTGCETSRLSSMCAALEKLELIIGIGMIVWKANNINCDDTV